MIIIIYSKHILLKRCGSSSVKALKRSYKEDKARAFKNVFPEIRAFSIPPSSPPSFLRSPS